MAGSPSIRRLALFAFALTACGPGPGSTSATTGTTTEAGTTAPETTTGSSTTGTTTTSSTTGTPTTSAATSEALSTSEATTEEENPCGCADADVCIQHFDGICTLLSYVCLPNPDGCVPGYPCSEACRPFCDGETKDSCNNSDCPDEVDGAVHCFGH